MLQGAADNQISPWTLVSWVLSFILNAAGQPSGKVMGLQPYEHADLRRCFPVEYTFDGLLVCLLWLELLAFHAKGPREAATIILKSRLTDAHTVESQMRAIQSMKSGAAMRVIGFVIGVLPAFIKLCACEGVTALQALGCLWIAPWVVLEALILASISTPKSDHREGGYSGPGGDDLQIQGCHASRLQTPCSTAADMIGLVWCSTPFFMFARGAWRKVAAAGLAESSPLDIAVVMAASCLLFTCLSWASIVVIIMGTQKDGVLPKRLKQVFSFGSAFLLGGIWLPLAVLFARGPKNFEVAFTIFLGAMTIGILMISFIRLTFWKTDTYHLVNILGAVASILLHIFINYKGTGSYQPQWLALLG